MNAPHTFSGSQRRTSRGLPSMIALMAFAITACSAPPSQQPAPAASAAQSPTEGQPSAPAPQDIAGAPPSTQPAQAPAPKATSRPASAPATAAAPARTGTAAPAPAAVPAPAPVAALAPAPAPAPAPVPPKPRVAHLKAGQALTVRTTRVLSTKTMNTGEVFSAILEEPITSEGWVVAAAGARVDGRIVEADKGGRLKGKASLSIELTSLTTSDGQKVEIVTSPVSADAAADRSKDAAKVGIGAGAGAAVGAIAGGKKGAAVGALLGGGAGAAMRGEAAEIPAETVLSFELRSQVTIQEKK